VLSDEDIRALEHWVRAARLWAESSQTFAGAAIELTASSEALADLLARGRGPLSSAAASGDSDGDGHSDRARLVADLRVFARTIEDEAQEFRDRYLEAAASIDQYRELFE
jgi:hypothetical protein